MNPNDIVSKIKNIKNQLNRAFENKSIDFDKINSQLDDIIESLQSIETKCDLPVITEDYK